MNEMNASVQLQSKMHFLADANGHQIPLDADEAVGGEDRGARPKALVLTALLGCTGMDVISILRKMRVEVGGFSVEAKAKVADEHPKVFTHILLTYHFSGSDLPMDKLEKAIVLSHDRYCPVSAMLKQSTPIDWEIKTEDASA